MCFPLKPCVSLLCRMSEMDASSKIWGHMTNFFYGFLNNRGGTTCPLAQITPLSPMVFQPAHAAASSFGSFLIYSANFWLVFCSCLLSSKSVKDTIQHLGFYVILAVIGLLSDSKFLIVKQDRRSAAI